MWASFQPPAPGAASNRSLFPWSCCRSAPAWRGRPSGRARSASTSSSACGRRCEKICFVISPGKSDILEYYGGGQVDSAIAFVVQPKPAGLCDAIFRAAPLIHPEEHVVIGLPDTVWFPVDGLCSLPDGILSFLLFPVEQPELFDAVVTEPNGRVREIQVKQIGAESHWVWGAFKMPGTVFHTLHALWLERARGDEYFGTLVNAWLARGGEALGIPAGESYVDVGTLHGYRAAQLLLSREREAVPPRPATPETLAAR